MESSILNLFRDVKNTQKFIAGETVFTEGSTGREMYVVLDGNVEIRVGGKMQKAGTNRAFFDRQVSVLRPSRFGGIHVGHCAVPVRPAARPGTATGTAGALAS